MKKLALILIVVMAVTFVTACTGDIEIEDGTYRAEYADFDAKGYKDFVEVTFEGGVVTRVVADGISGKDGSLKSDSEAYKEEMESIAGTYPEKYYTDLINQYLANPDADYVDTVAGATESSESFVVLLKALEKAIRTGYTDTIIVER
jgi:Major membrane immunogen, membrane-anchored lipoprotein